MNIIEIIASKPLRETLGLNNGDVVNVVLKMDKDELLTAREKLGHLLLWAGRGPLYYSTFYSRYTSSLEKFFGCTQSGESIGLGDLARRFWEILTGARKKTSRRTPKQRAIYMPYAPRNSNEESIADLMTIIQYTKNSGSSYAATQYPAAYHSLSVCGIEIRGQREPGARLESIDLEGRSVLDIGCNQGGMLFEARRRGAIWGVGVDFDSRMINAANKVRQRIGENLVDFFVFDLESEDLRLIKDFLPSHRVDVIFLLSVCMWISNWRDVISFCAEISSCLLFETNGTPELQEQQIKHLEDHYNSILLVKRSSDDDPRQHNRKLLWCERSS